eukprot:scaffold134487_cov17-Tisochrysis_lutea.AAC.1
MRRANLARLAQHARRHCQQRRDCCRPLGGVGHLDATREGTPHAAGGEPALFPSFRGRDILY